MGVQPAFKNGTMCHLRIMKLLKGRRVLSEGSQQAHSCTLAIDYDDDEARLYYVVYTDGDSESLTCMTN